MKLLALDTATLVASVAVVDRGPPARALAAADSAVDTHSDNLLPLVDQVLTSAGCTIAEIDAIAVGAGPGSFTGLRIGMASAKGLAFAADKPLYAVSSLAALAAEFARAADPERGAPISALLVPVLDARRDEVFAGFYAAGPDGLRAVADERVLPPEALAAAVAELSGFSGALLFGDGVAAYPGELAAVGELRPEARQTPSAIAIAELALAGEPVDVLMRGAPTYLRPSEAEIKFPNGNPGWDPGRGRKRS